MEPNEAVGAMNPALHSNLPPGLGDGGAWWAAIRTVIREEIKLAAERRSNLKVFLVTEWNIGSETIHIVAARNAEQAEKIGRADRKGRAEEIVGLMCDGKPRLLHHKVVLTGCD
jgi:hypothetical protein